MYGTLCMVGARHGLVLVVVNATGWVLWKLTYIVPGLGTYIVIGLGRE